LPTNTPELERYEGRRKGSSVYTTGPDTKTTRGEKGIAGCNEGEKVERRTRSDTVELENCSSKAETGMTARAIGGNLKCFYTNANSLRGKMEEFRDRVREMRCDVAGITETWADAEIVDAELAVDGFDMFRVNRRGRKGGGVMREDESRAVGCAERV
jgi:hypothetical protein